MMIMQQNRQDGEHTPSRLVHCLQRPFHLYLIDGITAGNQQLKLFKQPFGLR